MPILGAYGDSSNQSSLRLPAQKRISTPTSVRLSTITEGANGPGTAPPIPRRSSRRNSASHSESNSRRHRWSGTTQGTHKTAPPPYDWVPEPITGGSSNGSDDVVDERLEKLRSEGRDGKPERRGGLKRALLICIAVLAVLIALGVGLGVGLTRRKHKNAAQEGGGGTSPPEKPPQKFPLGEYSMDTALRSVSTDCTSNPATWRCFPYIVYNPDGSTDDTSVASFNWIITNSSSTYATNMTSPTSADGVPANLTVSTSNDPFGISFTDRSLKYISTESNATSARYTFSFTLPRRVIPSPAITTDNTNAVCFYNQTLFTASLYLSAGRVFPDESASIGGYEPWPYAVEIIQSAAGGSSVPDCYETVDGRTGQPISTGLTPQSESAECMCDYRNY